VWTTAARLRGLRLRLRPRHPPDLRRRTWLLVPRQRRAALAAQAVGTRVGRDDEAARRTTVLANTNEPTNLAGRDPQEPQDRGVEDRVDRKSGPEWKEREVWVVLRTPRRLNARVQNPSKRFDGINNTRTIPFVKFDAPKTVHRDPGILGPNLRKTSRSIGGKRCFVCNPFGCYR